MARTHLDSPSHSIPASAGSGLTRRGMLRAVVVAGFGLATLELLAACSAPTPAAAPTAAPAPTTAPAATTAPAPTTAAAAAGAPKKGGTLTLGTSQTITTLDPAKPGLL